MNKLTIDEKMCVKHKLSVNEMILAWFVRNGGSIPSVLDNMLKREILVLRDGKYQVTMHWSDVIDEVLCDSSGSVDDEERLRNLAREMQKLYPEGKSPGTPYYYRCNVSEILKKLKKFFVLFGNYSDGDILDATRRYVASFNGNYQRLRLIKYFILKDAVKQGEEGSHVEQVSDLLTYLENKTDMENVNNDDWMVNVRN